MLSPWQLHYTAGVDINSRHDNLGMPNGQFAPIRVAPIIVAVHCDSTVVKNQLGSRMLDGLTAVRQQLDSYLCQLSSVNFLINL